MDRFEAIQGYWWLPSAPDNMLSGTLLIREDGPTELTVLGSWTHPMPIGTIAPRVPVVFGVSAKGEQITLSECLVRSSTFNAPGIPTAIICPYIVFRRAHIINHRLAEFYSASVEFGGIIEWLGVTGLSIVRPHERNGLTLNYELPRDITIDLNDNLTLVLSFWWSGPLSSQTVLAAQIEQGVRLKVMSAGGAGYHDLYATLNRLANFFTLAFNYPVSFREMIVESREFLIDTPEGAVSEAIVSTPGSYEEPTATRALHAHDMLFRYRDVEPEFDTMIRAWYQSYETLEPALNMYFALERRSSVYMEQRFLGLVQALEALHRRTTASTPSRAHTTRLAEIMKAVPEVHREWLSGRLTYSHEPPLRRRLVELIKPFREIFGSESQRSRFIDRVVATRNYLTHYDETSQGRAVAPNKLWPYMYLLRLVFVLRCLAEIGFDAERARRIVAENNVLRQYRQLGLEGIQ